MATGDPLIFPDVSRATVLKIVKIRDVDNYLAAVQIVFSDQTALVCTVWTDWSLVLKDEPFVDLPSYLCPPEDYTFEIIDVDLSGNGSLVTLQRLVINEVGTLMGIDIKGEYFTVSMESYGGELRAQTYK